MFTGSGVSWNKTRSRSADDNEWSEHLDGFSTFRSGDGPPKQDSIAIVWHWLEVPILLALVGLSSALLSYATSTVLTYNAILRSNLLSHIPQYLELPAFCLYSVIAAVIACFVSQLICKECVGSGLSDMKTILSGVVKPVLLSRRLIVAKTLGLWLSLMAGLSVGREGPFVQISGAIADQLMKLSPFVHIRRQDTKRLEILACACASGVSATFGNAFGGVLFSIEFTSSAYLVRTLPKAFLTSVVAMLAFLFLGVSDELSLFKGESQSLYKLPKFEELAVFFLVGLGGAFLGILFVYMVEGVVAVRNSVLDASKHTPSVVAVRRYGLVAGVTLFVSCGLYLELSRVPSTASFGLLQYLFSTERMPAEVVVSLCFFSVYKFFATLLSVTLPLPVGLFTPTFVIGGLIGRILGEVLQAYPGFDGYAPWEYALLGAAAFSTGVTRAISTSVIIFELACQPHLGLPLSVVVLTSHFVGNRFAKNIYDVLMEASGAPFLDDLPPELYTLPVGSVMMPIRDIHVLALDSTYRDAAELLEATEASHYGSDNHASNGIYVEVTNVELELPGMDSGPASLASLVRPASTPEVSQRNGGSEVSPLLGSPQFARYQLDENAPPTSPLRSDPQQHHAQRRRYYAPTVIPIVQSRQCMVIVGGVLRKDLKEALRKLRVLSEVAETVPVVLGRANGSGSGHGTANSYQNAINRPSHAEAGRAAVDGLLRSGLYDPGAASSADLSAPSMDRQAEFLSQTIQYIIVTDDGKSIQPVVNAARVNAGSRRSLHRAVAYHTLPMAVPLDPSPYQVVDSMHLSKVDMVFRLLSLNQAYVTNSGRVVGIVTRALLRDYLAGKGRKPADRCKKFCLDLWHNFWSTGSNGRGES